MTTRPYRDAEALLETLRIKKTERSAGGTWVVGVIGGHRFSALVLKESGQPMKAKELIDEMAKRSLWSSPNGKTPEATLYAAMLREIKAKGEAARFRKVDRGQFAAN